MLLSAALRRRPECRCLLADPRLRPAAVANNRAAVSCASDGGISVLADELPLGLEAQHKLDKEWCAARSAALSPPSELKRKPPSKKTNEKMRTKKKKEPEVSKKELVAACKRAYDGWALEDVQRLNEYMKGVDKGFDTDTAPAPRPSHARRTRECCHRARVCEERS